MQNFRSLLLKLFYLLGERLAFLLLLIVATIVFFVESTPKVKAYAETSASEQIIPQTAQILPPSSEEPTLVKDVTSVGPISFEIARAVATPSPTPLPSPTPIPVDANSDEVWDKLADCESHKNWKIDTGNGYYGGIQFSQGAWESVGGNGKPSDASREEQISKGKLLQSRRGWGPWGGCAKALGLL